MTPLNRNIGADVLSPPFNGGHPKPLSTCPLVHLVLIISYDNTLNEIIQNIILTTVVPLVSSVVV